MKFKQIALVVAMLAAPSLALGQTNNIAVNTPANAPLVPGKAPVASGAHTLINSDKSYPSGDIVGTTDGQTLTNKNIDSSQLTGTIVESRLPTIIATGANTSRSIATTFGDNLNLKSFGLIGDGATDNTLAFSSARSLWWTAGGNYAATYPAATAFPIYVPPGSFSLPTPFSSTVNATFAAASSTLTMISNVRPLGWTTNMTLSGLGLPLWSKVCAISTNGLTVTLCDATYTTALETNTPITAAGAAIIGVMTGQTVIGQGASSQLVNAGIGINGRRARVSGLLLSGAGAVGVQYSNGQSTAAGGANRNGSFLSDVFVSDKTIGVDAQNAGQDELVNLYLLNNGTGFNGANSVTDMGITNCRIQASTGNTVQLYGSQQAKFTNCSLTGAGQYNLWLFGDNINTTLENYYVGNSLSGPSGRTIPYTAVTSDSSTNCNSGPCAIFTVASPVSITSIAAAGNTLSEGAASASSGIAYSGRARSNLQPTTVGVGDAGTVQINGANISGTITSGSTSLTTWNALIAAAINAASATNGGYTAQIITGRVMVFSPIGATYNGNILTFNVTSGAPVFSMPARYLFTLASTVPVAIGADLWIQGTGICDGTVRVEYTPTSSSFVSTLSSASCVGHTGTIIPQWRLWGGQATIVSSGSVYTTTFNITAVSSNHTQITTDAPYISNDTGNLSVNGWDVVAEAHTFNTRVSDQFFVGGNQNDTLIESGFNFGFNGTRLKHSIWVDDRANSAERASQILRVGTSRGRASDQYTPVPICGAATGWGEVIYGDDSGSATPGGGYVRMDVPSSAGGLTNSCATRLNGFWAYEDKLIMQTEGQTFRWGNSTLGLLAAGDFKVSTLGGEVAEFDDTTLGVDFLRFSGGTSAAHSVAITAAGSDTNVFLDLRARGATGQVRIRSGGGTAQFSANDTGIGFFGLSTPVAKPAPTGTCAGNTGCQALRDSLNSLGLITGAGITD